MGVVSVAYLAVKVKVSYEEDLFNVREVTLVELVKLVDAIGLGALGGGVEVDYCEGD